VPSLHVYGVAPAQWEPAPPLFWMNMKMLLVDERLEKVPASVWLPVESTPTSTCDEGRREESARACASLPPCDVG